MPYIAYLNTQYPSLSHTFIEREIQWVREAGIDIQPISIRRPTASGTLGQANQRAAGETVYILDGVASLLSTLLMAMFTRPFAAARLLAASQSLSPPGIKQRLKHLAYAWEALRLSREMRSRGLDHVHVHMANNGASVALLATRYDPRLSYSLTVHGPTDFYEVEQCRLTQKLEQAIFVRCISDFCRSQVMTWSDPEVWSRFHVLHCGVDPEQLAYAGPATSGRADVSPAPSATTVAPLNLITIGRIVNIKGYSILLDACAQCSASNIDWHLTMIGDGPQLDYLKRRAAELNIAGHITFTGPVSQDDLPNYLERADIMVVPSFMEGVPTVLMEAMAKGLPVIATNVAGVAELVDDGVSGWVVRAASVEHLTQAITQAYQSRDSLTAMGLAGREKVCTQFEVRQMGRMMSELFEHYLVAAEENIVDVLKTQAEPVATSAAP